MDVARLHKPRTVYGDFKGGKLDVLDALFILQTSEVRKRLIDNTGFVRIADFGLVSIIGLSAVLLLGIFFSPGVTLSSESGAVESTALRFQPVPPQLVNLTIVDWEWRYTKWVGRYIHYNGPAFIRPQVLTSHRPFHRIFACTPVPAMLRGERAEKAFDVQSRDFFETSRGWCNPVGAVRI